MIMKKPAILESEYFAMPVAPHMKPVVKHSVNLSRSPRMRYKVSLLERLYTAAPNEIKEKIIQLKKLEATLETSQYENANQFLLTTIAIFETAKSRTFFSSKLNNKLIEMLINGHGTLTVRETISNFARQHSIGTVYYPVLQFKEGLNHLPLSTASSSASLKFQKKLAALDKLISFFDIETKEQSFIRCTAILNYCAEQKIDFSSPYYQPESIEKFQEAALKKLIAETLFAQMACDTKIMTFTSNDIKVKFKNFNIIRTEFRPSVQEALELKTNPLIRYKHDTTISVAIYSRIKSNLLSGAYKYPWFYQLVNDTLLLMQYGLDKLDVTKQLEKNILNLMSFFVGQHELINFLKVKYDATKKLGQHLNENDTEVFIPTHLEERIQIGLQCEAQALPADIERLWTVTIQGQKYEQDYFKSLYKDLPAEKNQHGQILEKRLITMLCSAGINNELVAKFLCHQFNQQAMNGLFYPLQTQCVEKIIEKNVMLNPNSFFYVDIKVQGGTLSYEVSTISSIRNMDASKETCALHYKFLTEFFMDLEAKKLELKQATLAYSVKVKAIEEDQPELTPTERLAAQKQANTLNKVLNQPDCWGEVNKDLESCKGLKFNLPTIT